MSLVSKTLLPVALGLAVSACGSDDSKSESEPDVPLPAGFDPSAPYSPGVQPGDLSATITNSLFPGATGARWVLEAQTDEGKERIEISIDGSTKDVWGTTATIIRDTVYLDGEMIEDTWDWFAQDTAGNVWYLGEETYEYENGEVVCDCGAWEAGINDALPGIIMMAEPKVGESYRQEFLKGEAEDLAEVLSVNESVTVPAGSFTGCLKTRDLSTVDRTAEELKYYCPGVGLVLETDIDGEERAELVEYEGVEPL